MSVKNCTNPETDSCFSAAGRYNFNNGSTAVLSGVARGCIPCPSKERSILYIYIYFYIYCARRGGLTDNALDSGSKGLGATPGRVIVLSVLGQETLLSQCLSPPRSINGYQQTIRET